MVDTRASAGHRSRPGCGNHLKGFVFLFDEGSGDHTIIVQKSKWVAKLEDRQDFGHVSTVQDNTNLENDIISSITQLMTSLRQRHTLSLSLCLYVESQLGGVVGLVWLLLCASLNFFLMGSPFVFLLFSKSSHNSLILIFVVVTCVLYCENVNGWWMEFVNKLFWKSFYGKTK